MAEPSSKRRRVVSELKPKSPYFAEPEEKDEAAAEDPEEKDEAAAEEPEEKDETTDPAEEPESDEEEEEEDKEDGAKVSFIMFVQTESFQERSRLEDALEKKFPDRYEFIDASGPRVSFRYFKFPRFVQDVKAVAAECKIPLVRLMAVPDPLIGLMMDFPEDAHPNSEPLDPLLRLPTWKGVAFHLRPSSYRNWV